MKIQNYLTSLLPSFGKDQVLEDCRVTRSEIKEVTLPAYDAALPLLKGWKFKSKELENDFGSFGRLVKKGSDNFVVAVHKNFKTILENLDEIEVLVEKTYNEEEAGQGFTYPKANLLHFVECVSFVSKFARKYLNYIYICETIAVDADTDAKLNDSLAPAEIEWLHANFVSFCTALNVVSTPTATVMKQIADIPDIVITHENATTLPATVGEHKLDPFQMKLIPVWMNPIYHVGMFIAEWQANRYRAAQEEMKLLQLRKLNLEKISAGKPDARIQKEITYMESRIQGLNYKIAKMEKDHG